jgi:hypothetical protein
MPDIETLDVPLSGINPDLQLSLNSGKLTHYPSGQDRSAYEKSSSSTSPLPRFPARSSTPFELIDPTESSVRGFGCWTAAVEKDRRGAAVRA